MVRCVNHKIPTGTHASSEVLKRTLSASDNSPAEVFSKRNRSNLPQFTLSARAIACANARVEPPWKTQPANTAIRSVRFSNVTVDIVKLQLVVFLMRRQRKDGR